MQNFGKEMSQQKIVISATFTSEPIEDSLSYWLQEIGSPYSVEFSPYNQVFQELLNPASLLASNQNGVNVILVRLEDWEGTQNRLQLKVDNNIKTQIIGDRSRHTLPNHLEIAHLNPYETEYLYQEIFVDRVYSKHGIVFNEDDCIIDVGANIGLFTLFAQQKSPKGSIYAFEPAPHAFDKLEINAKLYCQNTHLFNCGLGGTPTEETFTFYPRSSVFSSFAADTEQDEKAIRSVIVNILKRDNSLDEASLERLADEFLKDRLERETYQAQVRTLSEIIEEYNIEKIDLLKLDAEKSELAILQGIKDHHWSLIQQIVMEVHDQEGSTIKQVMALLQDKGFKFVVDEESLLQGSGLYNIYATRLNPKPNPQPQQFGQNATQIEKTVRDFGSALKTARILSQNPYLVCICPPSPTTDTASNLLHEKIQEQLAADIHNVSGIHLIKSQELINTYPVEDYYDPYGDELGHIPYTPTLFCALGTMLARKIWALKTSPYKVIVLDCDNTLWNGICGEDGVTGIKMDAPYLALQDFIIEQQKLGKLICLCSKNQAEDVWEIFDQHPEILLKREHLVSWRINWQSKSENIKSIAAELQLGLDSFIFIDDNPIECAEVKANCPDVLTLQLPQKCDRIPQFLQHIWAFDQLQVTQEDQQRTNLYQQNIQRQRLQEDSLSFRDFLAQLNLEIEISPIQNEQFTRVAQLTQRTNQFNLTTIRRSEAEIQQLCNSGKLDCRVVKVKDRFGDYGLVGLLLFEIQENTLIVDTFLLSCRVLGRGVEHKMLAYLGTIAQEKGLEKVELFYKQTPKNKPIFDFLTSVGKQFQQEKDGGWLFEFPSHTASEIIFKPGIDNKNSNKTSVETTSKSQQAASPTFNSDFFEHIAQKLYSPELILQEITAQQQRQRPQLEIEFVAPRTPIEKAIASLFSEVLNIEIVGINDNFFELGGDSIQGAILINKLQAKLNTIIHFVVLFDTKTVAKLAAYLEEHYPQAIAKIQGEENTVILDTPKERINTAKVEQLRSLIPPLALPIDDNGIKNPPAIFILSPHRSGSTLLRVILGGNPKLFAPPELELLRFNTLAERKKAFSGRYSFWMEGTIRTLMQIRGCSAEEAIALMAELEAKNLTTKQFYQLLQQGLDDDKILVDKTPSYSIDLETLKRAEINFQNPLYIHLMRHPYATMRSYEEAKVEQTFPYQHPFKGRELAELVWLISHQNIIEFLQQVPQQRQYQVKFEDLVRQPQTTVEGICQFLGVEFYPDMLQPYKENQQRMTDGIYAESRMVGDVKFHEYQGINPSTADRWQQYYTTDFLGDVTWQLAQSLGYAKTSNAIAKVNRENITKSQTFPVSFAQQRLWILAQLEPDNPFYNMFKAVRLNGRLDIDVLERSLNEMIRRHEILRTTFSTVKETPVQVIAPHATLNLAVVDLQEFSGQDQLEQLQQVATQDQLQPFDLTQRLLLRVTLVQLQPESSALLLTLHHIIGDGWSLGVLLKELSSVYRSFLVGEPSPLAELPIQYADFTIWQRQWLQGPELQPQINYWQQQLADVSPLLELPTDRPRPSVQTFRGQCFSFQLDAKLTASLKALSHSSGTTLFMTLMAAYATLLCRYSGQEDILFGTPIANRNHPDIEGLIGFFVNTLVMRTRLEGNPSFSELLTQVRSTCLDAYANQDVPFETIVETLQIERSLSHSPLFQVMFALQNATMGQFKTPELEMTPLNLDNVNAKFDLTLQMWETNTDPGNCLQGFWQYNTDLFNEDRIARMTGHFQTLLAGIVANPEAAVGTLPLLTEAERHQLLVEWNRTQTHYPDKKCIHQIFEEQVEQNSNAVAERCVSSIAVVYENESLTYGELNQQANQLAHYLQSLGVTTETLVGICVERSPNMIIAILAILKAGGAYVPLDPSYPTERLAYMLNDSEVSILLTQEQLIAQIPQTNAQVICFDTDWETVIHKFSPENPVTETSSHNLAYVIYTSGSTGKPKGVMVEHKGLYNLALAQIEAFGVNSDSRVLQFASFSFDACIWEILMSLGSGAALYLGTKDSIMPGQPLIEQLRDRSITHITLPPSALAVLPTEELPQLQTIIVAGEASSVELIKTWSVGRNFFNAYGPTEASVCATIAKCSDRDHKITIGRPIANVQVHILDSHNQQLPIGVAGELHIGGAGVARGYLNRPELTQQKFIPNPFDTHSDSRLYKTGDLARYLPNGNIEFMGRIDNQVKIRGFRIELSEIEVVLTQHPQVRDAVVIARVDQPGIKRLAAYVTPEGKQPTSRELRSFLQDKLPDYMVPVSFTVLDAFPITPNGKVDRRALPVPEFELNDSTDFVSPRTPAEKVLREIWQDVLRFTEVSIHDNFFELGGDSIIGIQIIARAKQAGLELTPKQLFAHQTIAELAAVAGTSQGVSIEQGLVTGEVPLTPIQHWFFEHNLPQKHYFNQSFLLSVPSDFQPKFLEKIWQQLITHHDALRLRFTQLNDHWQQIHSAKSQHFTVTQIDLSTLPDYEQQAAIEATANSLQASLNLAENLVKVAFFDLGVDKRARLLIIIHHLVIDGVSWRILLEDFQTAYEQIIQGQNIQLPAKTTSFKKWAQHQLEYAQSAQLKSELPDWLSISQTTSISPIPVDYQGGENTVASASTVSVSLDEAQTQALLQDVPKAYKTQINDVLLTALVLVLSKWIDSDAVLFNLEGHGRENIVEGVDLSRTVGWFTTIFPVVLSLPDIDTDNIGNTLKSIKEQLRAIPNKGIGYGLLRYLSLDSEISAQLLTLPPPQISFNYLGQFTQVMNQSSMIQLANESSGENHSLQGKRPHLLNINAIITNERLQIDFKYSTNVHQPSTLDKIAQEFIETLEEIIIHCSSPENQGYTPTDFSLLQFDQLELDQLLENL